MLPHLSLYANGWQMDDPVMVQALPAGQTRKSRELMLDILTHQWPLIPSCDAITHPPFPPSGASLNYPGCRQMTARTMCTGNADLKTCQEMCFTVPVQNE